MKIKVKFFALIREIAGAKELEIEVKESMRVIDLLEELANMLSEKFRDYVFEGNEVSKSLIILVNGKGISEMKGLETELRDGDEVALLPPVSGG
ncbi:MAG: ubiquitin-like small modifier protein 1 [Candidatus Nezhaarchaeales archaeon]